VLLEFIAAGKRPADAREKVTAFVDDIWNDGFLAGTAKLPRVSPFRKRK
jgi:hypothetical protein